MKEKLKCNRSNIIEDCHGYRSRVCLWLRYNYYRYMRSDPALEEKEVGDVEQVEENLVVDSNRLLI